MRSICQCVWIIAVVAGCGPSPAQPDLAVADLTTADLTIADLAAPDLRLLLAGDECKNGIGGQEGQCAPGLKCCQVPCVNGPFDGGCLDVPSACEPQPPPVGYGPCF
jgi:hypothetical protein